MPLIAVQRNLARFGGMLEMALTVFCCCLLAAIFVSVFTGVIVRYVSMVPWSWTEEVARFCLVWFGPLAAAIGARRGSHFAFQWALMPLPPSARRGIRHLGNVLIICFLLLMVKLSVGFLSVMENQTSLAMEMDMRIPAAGLAVGFGVLTTMYVLELADGMLSLFTRQHFSIRERQEMQELQKLEAETRLVHPAVSSVPAE